MRILHLGYSHVENPWNAGGAAAAVREVYRRLVGRHEITVVCGGWPGAPDAERPDGVREVFGPCVGSYIGSRLGYSWFARRTAAHTDCDLVIDDMSAYSPSFAWRQTGRPCVALLQLDLLRATLKYPVIGRVARRFVLEALAAYENFVYVSPSLMKECAPLTPACRRAVCIPNGVSADLLALAPQEHPYILFLGRLDAYAKGLDALLREFKVLNRTMPDVRLVIAGSGPDERRLRALAARLNLAQAVEFVGRVSGTRKADLLRQCLCVAMPSRNEGWPLVAMEAAACGKVVVGHAVPGLWDAVVRDETGLLVDPEQEGALAAALERVIRDGPLRATLGGAARRRAAEFSWERTAERYEQFYTQVLRDARGGNAHF